jgi:DNA-binding response OmpR family regulator
MARKKVLIVDDNPYVLQQTGDALEAAGYGVVLRSRGEGTVAAVLQERPDLVLLDVNAPRLSGDTIAVILARTDPDRKTIVLLHSSLSPELLKLKVLQTGASGFLVKTGNPQDVVAQVNVWMKRRFGITAGTAEPSPTSVSSATLASVATSTAPPSGTVQRSTPDELKHPSGAFKRTVPSVLFVDDDTFTLAGYRRVLAREAIAPSFSSTADDALRKITSDNPPDVVVSDMLMPRTDGMRLFQAAVEHDPSWRLRFIFATGARSVLYVEKFLSTINAPVLHKPVNVDELMRAIRIVTIASTGVERTPPLTRETAEEGGG